MSEDDTDKLKRDIAVSVAVQKVALGRWIDDYQSPIDQATAAIAMLETAFDRFIATHGEQDAIEIIQTALRKAVAKGGMLQ